MIETKFTRAHLNNIYAYFDTESADLSATYFLSNSSSPITISSINNYYGPVPYDLTSDIHFPLENVLFALVELQKYVFKQSDCIFFRCLYPTFLLFKRYFNESFCPKSEKRSITPVLTSGDLFSDINYSTTIIIIMPQLAI